MSFNQLSHSKLLFRLSILLYLLLRTYNASEDLSLESLNIHQLDITAAQNKNHEDKAKVTIFITIFGLDKESVHFESSTFKFVGHPLTWGYIETKKMDQYNELKKKFKKLDGSNSPSKKTIKEILKEVKDYLIQEKLKLVMEDQSIDNILSYRLHWKNSEEIEQNSEYRNNLGDYCCKFTLEIDTTTGHKGRDSKLIKATGYNFLYDAMGGSTGPNVKLNDKEKVEVCKNAFKEMSYGGKSGGEGEVNWKLVISIIAAIVVAAVVLTVFTQYRRKKKNKKNKKAEIRNAPVTQAIPVSNY